ncbi:MAG: RDD family protein [Erysipelotrichaceae bacterium]
MDQYDKRQADEMERMTTQAQPSLVLARILAGAIDLIFEFAIMYVWLMLMLLMVGDLFPYKWFPPLQSIFFVLQWMGALLVPLWFLFTHPGLSVGNFLFGFQIIRLHGSQPSKGQLLLREVLLKPVLIIGLLYSFSYWGLLAYGLLNLLFILYSHDHMSLFDLATQTRLIKANAQSPYVD